MRSRQEHTRARRLAQNGGYEEKRNKPLGRTAMSESQAPTCEKHGTMVARDDMGREWYCAVCMAEARAEEEQREADAYEQACYEAEMRRQYEEECRAQYEADCAAAAAEAEAQSGWGGQP